MSIIKKPNFRAVDFFCGGGGFSEGFRQAGIEVVAAFDLWKIAVDTHNGNHPDCDAQKMDVVKISLLPDKEFHKVVPDTEIIIGSPPCTDFSNSNKSGNGDKSTGIKLIEAYLTIVARKKYKKNSILKYWILENVPKVQDYIKDSYKPKELGLKGNWNLRVKSKSSKVYLLQYFGVPSNRKRYFCGEFPEPKKVFRSDNELIPLKKVLKSLGEPKQKLNNRITDPNYGFSMKGEMLTDHHYFHPLADFEWKKAKQLKQDKGYMGKMSFPENLNKPSRTIMATMSVSARESFILSSSENNYKYRAPTIREVATLMSFPIDYQFYGNSVSQKYKLVGNSVPPKMSFALAKAILENEGLVTNNKYPKLKHNKNIKLKIINDDITLNIEKPKSKNSKFKYHIPYFIFNVYRVELTNYNSNFDKEKYNWDVEIHYSQGKRMKKFTPLASSFELEENDKELADGFIESLISRCENHNQFQKVYCLTSIERAQRKKLGPLELLTITKEFIVNNYSTVNYKNIELKEEPKSLPKPILIGYYILERIITNMKTKKIENDLVIVEEFNQ